MKYSALPFVVSLFLSGAALASPYDTIGGADGTTQTIHHCGYLETTHKLYTASATTTRIVEHKLSALGYATRVDGNYGKMDKRAVRAFQSDYGLAADGVVGPITAQKLAFISHPSAHTRGCQRLARN